MEGNLRQKKHQQDFRDEGEEFEGVKKHMETVTDEQFKINSFEVSLFKLLFVFISSKGSPWSNRPNGSCRSHR